LRRRADGAGDFESACVEEIAVKFTKKLILKKVIKNEVILDANRW
jgi:hypothetical protein